MNIGLVAHDSIAVLHIVEFWQKTSCLQPEQQDV